jgi:hypothetical protein
VSWDLGGEGERKKFCDAMWGWGHCKHCLHLHDGLLAAMMRNGFPFGAPGLERTFLFFSSLLFQIRMGWNAMPSFLVQYQYVLLCSDRRQRSALPDDADGVHGRRQQ